MPGYNVQGWGTGFDIGVIADLNVRDYLSLQPGVFFESRSNTYTFINSLPMDGFPASDYLMTQAGTFNSYALTIPIIGSMRFNITDDIRWNVDFGPYVSFMFGSKLKTKSTIIPSTMVVYLPQEPSSNKKPHPSTSA